MARRHPRLLGDTSVLGTPGRVRAVGRLLAAGDDILARLIHGSDFPFPSVPLAFIVRLGPRRAFKLQLIRNPLRRDLALEEALGFGRSSAERAHALLCR